MLMGLNPLFVLRAASGEELGIDYCNGGSGGHTARFFL